MKMLRFPNSLQAELCLYGSHSEDRTPVVNFSKEFKLESESGSPAVIIDFYRYNRRNTRGRFVLQPIEDGGDAA